jgi:ParB-like chromosome segregation protein Spo0J
MSVDELRSNPWHFRIMYQNDLDSIVRTIKTHGIQSVPNPLIAKIDEKYYVVDGHSRIKAAKKTDIKKIQCQILENITDFKHLRIQSFQHNKEGYSNPLLLSDMFYEDFQLSDIKKIAADYNVSEKYVESLLKIKDLHDDAKSIISKIMENSKKKYQFILNQITPQHLANLACLSPEKQIQITDWIFRDILYGPADESLVSIPSIYEIIDEIANISNSTMERKTYKKRNAAVGKQKEFPLICRCGIKFDVNTRTNTVYEHIEKNNVIIKRKFESDHTTKIFSSHMYGKSELIDLIKEAKGEFSIVFTREDSDDAGK